MHKHLAPDVNAQRRERRAHVATVTALILIAIVVAFVALLLILNTSTAFGLDWRAPELTDAQWGIFHKGARP
jgi:uncharacterized membrane protein